MPRHAIPQSSLVRSHPTLSHRPRSSAARPPAMRGSSARASHALWEVGRRCSSAAPASRIPARLVASVVFTAHGHPGGGRLRRCNKQMGTVTPAQRVGRRLISAAAGRAQNAFRDGTIDNSSGYGDRLDEREMRRRSAPEGRGRE